jgi:hypothetical protein
MLLQEHKLLSSGGCRVWRRLKVVVGSVLLMLLLLLKRGLNLLLLLVGLHALEHHVQGGTRLKGNWV